MKKTTETKKLTKEVMKEVKNTSPVKREGVVLTKDQIVALAPSNMKNIISYLLDEIEALKNK